MSTFGVKFHDIDRIATTALDWLNIEAKDVVRLMRTADVELIVAGDLLAFDGW